MTTTIISHDVKDFDTWLQGFNSAEGMRKEGGELSAKVFRASDSPNRVTVINEWASAEVAHSFLAKDELKAAMAEIGVVGPPTIQVLESA